MPKTFHNLISVPPVPIAPLHRLHLTYQWSLLLVQSLYVALTQSQHPGLDILVQIGLLLDRYHRLSHHTTAAEAVS
jgi:hypothetical protein